MPHSQARWPYLTADIPPIPAAYRSRPADFVVEEIPLYDPCGMGDHLYVWVEKAGISTRQAVRLLAESLGIPPERIGVAGQKDARAVTRQMLSLERVHPDRARAVRIPGLTVLDAARHRTKLRLGSLAGNRFRIRLRGVEAGGEASAHAVLAVLARRGVPNYFGPQRFGRYGDTWELGRALLAGDLAAARAVTARWPGGGRGRGGGPADPSFQGMDRWLMDLGVSAYQGWLFNQVLTARLDRLDRLLAGDLAAIHGSEQVIRVADPAAEQPRADRFAISPTGPMVGHTMPEPAAEAGAIEGRVLAAHGIRPGELPRTGPVKCVGGRRPLRFRPTEVEVEAGADDGGPFLELRFALPPGCYATALLREIGKGTLGESRPASGEGESAREPHGARPLPSGEAAE